MTNNIVVGSFVKYCSCKGNIFKIGAAPTEPDNVYIGIVTDIVNEFYLVSGLRILNKIYLPSSLANWVTVDKLTLLESNSNVSLNDILCMSTALASEQFLFVIDSHKASNGYRIVLKWEDSRCSNLLCYSGYADNDTLRKNRSLFNQIATRDLISLLSLPAHTE